MTPHPLTERTWRTLWRSVFFVIHDDDKVELDLGWAILLIAVINGMVAFDLEAAGVWKIPRDSWIFYGSFLAMAFIAGTTLVRARLITDTRLPAMIGGLFHPPATPPTAPLAHPAEPLSRAIDDPDAS